MLETCYCLLVHDREVYHTFLYTCNSKTKQKDMFRLAFLFVGLLHVVVIGYAAAFAPVNYNVLSNTNLAVGGCEKVTINTKTRLNAAALILQNKGGGHGELGTHIVSFL